jgi:putative transcriptional regulator
VYGFAKSRRENLGPDELQSAREIGAVWLSANAQRIARGVQEGELEEVVDENEEADPMAEAMLETANGMHRIGVMDDETYRKITVRHLGDKAHNLAKPISARQIRAIRRRANLSQAALDSVMNLTVGYVSQLERGVKEPKGPSLALLNIIRRKGIEAIL